MGVEDILAEIKALMEQGQRHHERGQHLLSLQCYQKAIPLAAPLGDASLMAALLQHAGSEHRDCDNYHHAVELLVAALALVPDIEEAIPLRASIKKVLAITFKDVFGPYKPEVLQLLEESRADYVHLGYEGQEANVLQHIGGVYIQTGRYAEADGVLQEALRKARAARDEQLVGWILDDMAELEIERNEWGTALEMARQARRKAQSVGDKEAEADTWITEGRVLLRMDQTDEALAAVGKALALYTDNQNLRRTIRARRHVARVLVRQGHLDDAVATLEAAMDTAARLDLRRDQAILHLDLGDVELARRNYGLAHQHTARARGLADDENLPDLLDNADDLLCRCHDEERRNE